MAYWFFVTTGRLTRQELGWLLAQEARGAAKILRQDVTLLSQPPPAEQSAVVTIPAMPDVRVSTTLDALDDAIGMLSELESGPSQKVARRGRIDLAALLWELAPTAQISIEPGAGTEVFGEEGDLRRILNVLVQLSNSAAGSQGSPSSAVRIRREGDWIRIGVDLGPDVSGSVDLERRWLSRMATQMGGHLDLEGGTIALLLPADASNDQSEVADLRKELEQAQQLGEAYARELAAAFAAGEPSEVQVKTDRGDTAARRFDLLVAMSSAVHQMLAPVFRGLREDAESLDAGPPSDSLATHVVAGSELVAQLGRIAACPRGEPAGSVDLERALRDAAVECEPRALRHGVTIRVEAAYERVLGTRPRALSVLLRTMLEHAIDATPRGGEVTGIVAAETGATIVTVIDGGPAVPASARADLLEHRVDPTSLGRPPGLGLLVTHTLAGYLGGSARLTESNGGLGGVGGFATEIRLRNS